MSGGGVGSQAAGAPAQPAAYPGPGAELWEQGGAAMDASSPERAGSPPAGGQEAGGSLPDGDAAVEDAGEVGLPAAGRLGCRVRMFHGLAAAMSCKSYTHIPPAATLPQQPPQPASSGEAVGGEAGEAAAGEDAVDGEGNAAGVRN